MDTDMDMDTNNKFADLAQTPLISSTLSVIDGTIPLLRYHFYNKYDVDAILSNMFYEISTNSPVIKSWVQRLSLDYVSYIFEASSEVKFLP